MGELVYDDHTVMYRIRRSARNEHHGGGDLVSWDNVWRSDARLLRIHIRVCRFSLLFLPGAPCSSEVLHFH